MTKQMICNKPLQVSAFLYLKMLISSLVLMDNYGRKWSHFSFKGICGPKTNIWEKNLIFFVTLVFIVEEWLSQFTLLNTGLARQFCSEILLKISENTFY